MAPVAVAVAPSLRPWRGAGVAFLLLEREEAEAVRRAARPAPSRSAGRPDPGSEPAAPPPRRAPPRRPPDTSPAVSPAPAISPVRAPRTVQPSAPLPPEWEELWRHMAAGSPRPRAVWTYPELGTDVRGEASADRRRVLRELIAALNMPKGSHAFWPYALPPGNAPALPMFLGGLARFRPAFVLLLGDRAASDLADAGPLPAGPLQSRLCRGYRFVRLPGMGEIAGSSASVRARLIEFIRTTIL